MEKFRPFASITVPIEIANCDTDQIIPARFLRRGADNPEYSNFLFHDLRFETARTEKDFNYNKIPYRNGQIFVAGVTWSCGSSQENAATELVANGIRSVIAPSIADIHYNNCIKNGVLPIQLSETDCANLRKPLRKSPGGEIAIDLTTQVITGPCQTAYHFKIKEFDKYQLLNGPDDLNITMELNNEILKFAETYKVRHSWAS